MSMYVLFANAMNGDEFESEFLEFACVSYARIVRSRGHSLFLSADSATTVAIALALSEFHQPERMESAEAHLQTLFVVRPIDVGGDSVEQAFVRDSIESRADTDHFLSTLLVLAGGSSGERRGKPPQFVELNRIAQEPIVKSVLTIGTLEPVQATTLSALVPTERKYSLSSLEEMQQDDLRRLLNEEQRSYNWYGEIGNRGENGNRMDDEQAREVRLAEEKARVHVAIEMLIDAEQQ